MENNQPLTGLVDSLELSTSLLLAAEQVDHTKKTLTFIFRRAFECSPFFDIFVEFADNYAENKHQSLLGLFSSIERSLAATVFFTNKDTPVSYRSRLKAKAYVHDLYLVIFVAPLEDMPLFMADKQYLGDIAKARLEVGV